MPPHYELLASTDISPIQIIWKPKQVLAIQAHPEFIPALVRDLVTIRHQRGIIDAQFASDTLSKVDRENDSDWLAGRIVQFMLGRL
jgi:GMP synthase-like glutamine amidotransferase